MNTVFRLLFKAKALIFFPVLLCCYPVFSQWNRANDPVDYEKQSSLLFQQPSMLFYDDYDVVFCQLDLHLERNTVYVEGKVSTTAKSRKAALGVYQCELVQALTVDSAVYNGNPAVFTHNGDSILVVLDPPVTMGNLFQVKIFYHGLPPTGGFFSGISSAVSTQWGNEVTWTLSQPFNAYQWWPCKQDLKDKIDSVDFFITTDSSNKAGSNGLLTAVTPLDGGKVRYEWKTRYPVCYYLISAAVADYQEYNIYASLPGMQDSVLIQHYIYDTPGCLDYYQWDLDNTRYFLELYSQLFGPYPFALEKYGHCQAQLGGGMEHQTMATMGAFGFAINCHELSHQWFGDYVTCASWSDVWVNEGFATYSQYLALEYIVSPAYADTFMMWTHQIVLSQPGGSVYIPPEQTHDVSRIFDGRLSYNKGAAILHSLRGEINNDVQFYTVLKQYLEDFGDSVATGIDFKQTAETVTGLDLDDFFDQWYFGEGYPRLNILWSQQDDTLFVHIAQSPSSPVTPLFRMSLDLELLSSQGNIVSRVYLDHTAALFKIIPGRTVEGILIDPHYWNLHKVESLNRVEDIKEAAKLILFPNPCADELHYIIQQLLPIEYEAILFDIQGKQIGSCILSPGSGMIDVSSLSSGVYLLQVRDKGVNLIRRFIRN